MTDLITITSKRQLTIPAKIFKKLNLEEGQKLIVTEENGKLTLSPALLLVRRLAGSVKVPAKLRGRDVDEVIREAKKTYFSRKK